MRTLFLVFLPILFFLLGFKPAQAQTTTTSTDRALYNLKESVSELVAAKDKNDKNSLAYRIVAFKQVIDLSLAEAEEVRSKLMTITPIQTEQVFYDSTLEGMTGAVNYFKTQRKSFNTLQIKNTDEIRVIAEKFKMWREVNYINTIEAATDYIAIREVASALLTAQNRQEKIGRDLDGIPTLTSPSRARVLGELSNLHLKARETIIAGMTAERQAYALFSERYLTHQGTSSQPTSSLLLSEQSTSTTSSTSILTQTTTSTSTSTLLMLSTSTTSSTITTSPALLTPSIKDLVRDSLTNVQGAYQIFIEMSKVVKILL